MIKHQIDKETLLALSKLAREGRVTLLIHGKTIAWKGDEFSLARAVISKALSSYTEEAKRKKRAKSE